MKLDTSVMTARPTTSTDYGGHSFNCKRTSDGLVLISYESPPCDGTLGFSNGSPGLTHPITGFRFTDDGVIVFIFHFLPNGNPPNRDVFIPVNLKVYNLNSMIGTSYNQNGNTVLTDTAARINTVWTGGGPYVSKIFFFIIDFILTFIIYYSRGLEVGSRKWHFNMQVVN